MGTGLVTLVTSKIRPRYVITEKKIEENCLLNSFSTQIPKFLLFLLIDKINLRTHNQLYAIKLSNICHCWIGHIGPLDLYKFGKKCLRVKLQGKLISQYLHYAFSKISQLILWQLSINISTKSFYQLFFNWLDL